MAASSADSSAAPSESLDERIARQRQQHACLRKFDELMFCMTPTNQFDKYYMEGTYDNCPTRFISWQLCLQTKISKADDAEALRSQEWRDSVPGKHMWAFRPDYAAEAYARYGVRPVQPTETQTAVSTDPSS